MHLQVHGFGIVLNEGFISDDLYLSILVFPFLKPNGIVPCPLYYGCK